MKIYIDTDLEGCTNVNKIEMMQSGTPENDFAYRQLALDINAAIQGAFEAGVSFVKVLDGHGGGNGLDFSLIDSRAVKDERTKPGWSAEIDETYDACFLIGSHAMAGTMNAFLDHTQSSMSWYNFYINGKKHGEIGQRAAMCAHFGVPLILVSGDEAACREAHDFLGDIEAAAVKRGIGRNYAQLYDPDICRENIKAAAIRAVENLKKGKYHCYTPILPLEARLELYRSDYCDNYMKKTGIERVDARTVRKVVNSYLDILF